ncbi:hypothetical protein AB6A40_003214 [Gnathostoma spinigerum]|uniref:Major sperm protein n=1 Tax=Gnathostoma spinigerum TaxID=75299 RepID=A0ABD6E8V7_9BILA
MNCQSLMKYEVTTEQLQEEIRKLSETERTYLLAEKPIIVMSGYMADIRLTYQLKLSNKHSQPVAFNIAIPIKWAFGARPRIGVILPSETFVVRLSFYIDRVARIPDDGIYWYTVFQSQLPEHYLDSTTAGSKERERLLRKFWSAYNGGSNEYLLRLPVVFRAKKIDDSAAAGATTTDRLLKAK